MVQEQVITMAKETNLDATSPADAAGSPNGPGAISAEPIALKARDAGGVQERPLCVVEAAATGSYVLPADLPIQDFNGLLLVGLVRYTEASPPLAKVVSYWRDADCYKAYGVDFWKATGLMPGEVGVQGAVRERRRPLWKAATRPLAVAAALGWLVTLGTNLGSLRQFWTELSTRPNCLPDVPEAGFRAVAGGPERPVRLNVIWHNDSAVDATIILRGFRFTPDDHKCAIPRQGLHPFTVKQYESAAIPLDFSASAPGRYQVQALGRVNNRYKGWDLDKVQFAIEFFPTRYGRPLGFEPQSDPLTRRLSGELIYGKALTNGATCIVSFTGAPGVHFESPAWVYSPDERCPVEETASEMIKTEDFYRQCAWSIGPACRYGRRQFLLGLSAAQPMSPEQWAKLYKTLQVRLVLPPTDPADKP